MKRWAGVVSGVLRTRPVAAGVFILSIRVWPSAVLGIKSSYHRRAFVEMCIVSCCFKCISSVSMWAGHPGAALIVVRLVVVPLPPRSTAPTMTGCRLVGWCEGGCPVVGGSPYAVEPLRGCRRASVLARGPSWPAVPRLRLRRRGRLTEAGLGLHCRSDLIGVWSEWDLLGVFRGGGRRGSCEEWARSG